VVQQFFVEQEKLARFRFHIDQLAGVEVLCVGFLAEGHAVAREDARHHAFMRAGQNLDARVIDFHIVDSDPGGDIQ
jgi:hypothetical protein